MARRLLNLLAALSLLLCVTTCALWAWSYWDGKTLWRSRLWPEGKIYRDRRLAFNVWDGRIRLTKWEGRYEPTPGKEALLHQTWSQVWDRTLLLPDRPADAGVFTNPDFSFAGVEHQRTHLGEGTSRHVQESLAIPLWMPATGFALMPVWVYARRRHVLAASRIRRGLCPRCAYDLTGNVSGVCPECGGRNP